MAWSEAEAVCRKHPNENPQPGVCPSCLRERLSRIAGRSRTNSNTYSSSPSFSASPAAAYYNYYSSRASSSGYSSPANHHVHRGHHRVASDIMDSIYFAISGNKILKKSRSMAFAPSTDGVNGKKKGGFWNKLLLLRSSGKKAKS